MNNCWQKNAAVLGRAYTSTAGWSRFIIATHAICLHVGASPARIVDIGGGFGRQALMLAREGYSVAIVDPDTYMLNKARRMFANEPNGAICGEINFISAAGEDAPHILGGEFDAVCCHNVIMYLENPIGLLTALVNMIRYGGIVSLISINPESIAMRSGLQQQWKVAANNLIRGQETGGEYLMTFDHSRAAVTEMMRSIGAELVAWYGVGIFSDHISEPTSIHELTDLCTAEWLAGARDPYRQVGRCYHLIFRRRQSNLQS